LSIDYGQRHARELVAARKIANELAVPHLTVDLSTLRPLLGGSSQTDPSIPVPHGHYAESTMKLTVVPNRNMMMLAVATAWAVSLGARGVAYAAHAGDHAVYPDCRPSFVHAMGAAMKLCDYSEIELVAPFITVTKAEIAAEAARLSVPIADTWSCYEGGEIHCGRCGTCVERREAFMLAGVNDPTPYVDPDFFRGVTKVAEAR
jgi:7-cyano-7-deazaguanine synthase